MRDHLEDRTFGAAYGTMTIFYAMAAAATIPRRSDRRPAGSFTASYSS
ncbi:MAG: hypothetical protein R2710_00620 [Acidimicrobiales bacterium]